MTFTDDLRETVDPIWTAIFEHPMVEGIGDGTLDDGPFRYWVRQDYVYLLEYSRVLAYGAAAAPTAQRMRTFATLLQETLTEEMDLHRSFAAEFGIDEADLAATEPSPTTRAYADFLVRTAATGTFGDLVAALLPCLWGFNETGVGLAEDGKPDHEQYARWIETYSNEEFTELATWCRELLDDVAAEAGPTARERYRERFVTSSRYEYLFWEAAWNREAWPV
ncbi:MAG: thiaminase II [Haloarculaceae archaeon]